MQSIESPKQVLTSLGMVSASRQHNVCTHQCSNQWTLISQAQTHNEAGQQLAGQNAGTFAEVSPLRARTGANESGNGLAPTVSTMYAHITSSTNGQS